MSLFGYVYDCLNTFIWHSQYVTEWICLWLSEYLNMTVPIYHCLVMSMTVWIPLYDIVNTSLFGYVYDCLNTFIWQCQYVIVWLCLWLSEYLYMTLQICHCFDKIAVTDCYVMTIITFVLLKSWGTNFRWFNGSVKPRIKPTKMLYCILNQMEFNVNFKIHEFTHPSRLFLKPRICLPTNIYETTICQYHVRFMK